jgi:hypothetical protein
MTRILVTALAVAACCGCVERPAGSFGGTGSSEKFFKSFENQTPPELAAAGSWINSDEPLSLAGLNGRVVWLEFSFLS